ncbi:hypothetical protein LTR84_005568 [Exophiala bonariae]|uniref:Uncharacterized protein n=1 Tax=Exophiala bonariae TaxID=1690606 RepID=A0AAV9N627_9EURO|nr:hypothetical protein LTR84_005568 [Exophiala bonariae]
MATPKVWFITGTSSGFGKEFARQALDRGDKVIATARTISRLQDLKQAGADILTLDVTTSPDDIKKVAEEAFNLYGRIDYLINNAGYALIGGIEETTHEDAQVQFATNVFGLLNVTRAFLPYFRAQRSGVIANLSSIGGWNGSPGVGLYCASKWAVSGISETLSNELAEFNIKVCCVEPGYFRSSFLNPGNKISRDTSNVIEDYEGTAVRRGEELLVNADNKQKGDPKKGVKVMIDVLTGATGKEVPMRLALGSDAYVVIRGKCEATIKLLDDWKDITTPTDVDE